jgi:hypothetical protein
MNNNNKILDFMIRVDTSSIESIQIYGYCDRELLIIIINYRNKVLTIQSLLTSIGFNKNKILIEGKDALS